METADMQLKPEEIQALEEKYLFATEDEAIEQLRKLDKKNASNT